jgi:hypothetical protein
MKKITGIILTILLSCTTFVSAQVTLSGATEASPAAINKSYTNLIAAFAAINGNASGLATDNLILELSASTTETAGSTSSTTTLNAPRGISATVVTPGATTYKFPQITLTGGTRTGIPGTFIVTINNGKVLTIANTGGTWTVAPTITIEGASGTNGLNVTTQATAICTAPSTAGNLTTYVTNGGAGYGPKTTVAATSGGSGAAISYGLISTATTPTGTGPLTIQPAAVAVHANSYVDNAGSGYTAGTAGATAPADSTKGGTFASGSAATAYSTITIPNANYASVKIYPTASGVVINSSTAGNQPFIVLNGAKNVTIDGRVHTAGVPSGGADLTIQHKTTATSGTPANAMSTNNASTIYLNAGANNNTITYCKLKSMTQNGNTRGTLAIGTNSLVNGASASSVGGSYNTISYNEFSPLNPSSAFVASGNGGMLTSASCNDDFPNSNNTIHNNTFDNYFIAGPTGNISAAIYIFGNTNPNKPTHSNNIITNNSFFNSVDGATTANNSRMFIKVGNSSSNLYGGFGHTISGNYIGGKAAQCAGGMLTKTGAYADNLTCIHYNGSNGASSAIQNNVIKNISMTNGTGAVANTTKFIDVYGYGNVSVTGNLIGDNGSIVIDNSTITNPNNLFGIYVNGVGNVTCENNTIANITHNTAAGNLYGIFHETGANALNANANLIHSLNVASTSTAAKIVGINCASGTNSITNNIVKLGDNNAATIYGLNEENAATASNFNHNTVYISGAPTTAALNSACMASNGSTNSRSIQNNIFVNARTNNGATGVHYALLMPAATGTVAVDYNDYQATGASGAMLGSYGGADVSTSSVIVTGQDANSLSVDPGFASAGGILAANYMTSTTLTGVSSSLTTDYSGTTRAAIQMGAWNKSGTTSVNNLVDNKGLNVSRLNNRLVISYTNELKSDASISVYNMIGRKLVMIQMINAITVLDNAFHSGMYLVTVSNGGETLTKKIVFN